MRKSDFFVFSAIILLFFSAMPAFGHDGEDRLRDELMFLTDTARQGRASGTPGAQSTVFYLLRELRNAGLRTTVQCFDGGEFAGRNVVAVTPGWFRNYIVVGAYFDGLGDVGGAFYPGADSNASGVAALLSLARTLSGLCKGSTGLIFVAFDGHNAGMSGSRAFYERFSREYSFRLMVNLDIVGATLEPVHDGRTDYLIALGGRQHYLSLERANRDFGLDLSYDYYGSTAFTDLFYRRTGEQSYFLQQGVPAVMFTSGITANTNKTGDTVDALDLPVLLKRISFIAQWLSLMI